MASLFLPCTYCQNLDMPDLSKVEANATDASKAGTGFNSTPHAGGSVSHEVQKSSSIQALGNAAMAAAQPAIQTGQAVYSAGKALYGTVSPTITKTYQELGRLYTTAQTTSQSNSAGGLVTYNGQRGFGTHSGGSINPNIPGRSNKPQGPGLTPPPVAAAKPVVSAKPIEQPLKQQPEIAGRNIISPMSGANSFARIPTNYNMALSPRITNLNSNFKPIKTDVPFEVALNNLKTQNIPKISQIAPIASIKPITNQAIKPIQAQTFTKLSMPKITPINATLVKPIASIKPIAMPKPVVANALKPISMPSMAANTMPKINPIDTKLVSNIKPISMPKPIVNTLKPISMPSIATAAIPKITPISNKPIASITPITMPKPIVNTLKPIQSQSFVRYTIPAITPINNTIMNQATAIKPISMPKPIATNIKAMPMPKFAHVDVPSLAYMGKTFNVEMPKIETITMPKMQPVKVAPVRLPDVDMPKYTMPKITVAEVKYQPISKQYVEKTIKVYDAKVISDASHINSIISPNNNLQKYFSSNSIVKIDLNKFIQNTPTQRKEIINQAQVYTNSVEVKKLEALNAWRNEYDKFMALSSNISNVVKETGEVDPASLEYLETVKENLDTLTRKITDMGVDKTAMQQVIKSSTQPLAINPLMKEKNPMPTALENPSLKVLPGGNMAPKVDILNGLTHGVSNIFTSTVHAEEQ